MLAQLRSQYDRTAAFLRKDLWELHLDDLPPRRAAGFRLLRVGLISWRGFVHDRCELRASALTFATLLSLVPVLATMFAIARGFRADEHLEQFILGWINQLGQEEVAQWLTKLTAQLLDVVRKTPVGALGAAGVVVLLLSVIKMLGTIEKSFNEIWGVSRARGFTRKVADYLSAIVVLSVLFGVPAVATGSLSSNTVVSFLAGTIGRYKEAAIRVGVFVLPWIGFAFLNMFMPNTKVRWRAALAGGILGGILWDLSIIAFVKFGIGVAKYNTLYGTFASAPVALVWLQLNWLIVLLSAELTYAFQNERSYVLENAWAETTPAEREALALAVMAPIAAHFRTGRPAWTPAALADHLDAPLRLVNETLGVLAAKNIVVPTAGENPTYVPARSLEAIPVAEIIDAVGGYRAQPRSDSDVHTRAVEIQQRIHAAGLGAVNQMTAADLAGAEQPGGRQGSTSPRASSA